MLDLDARAQATERVVARFRPRAFDWRRRSTCIHLARAQLRAMGHRPPSIPDFRSPISARRALAAQGHRTLQALLDAMLPPIAPLRMIVGDLGLLPGEDGFESIVIAAGGNKVIGWHGGDLSRLHAIEVGKLDFTAVYGVGR